MPITQRQHVEGLAEQRAAEDVGDEAGAESSWNSFGNGPTDAPPSTVSARPLKISMPASVTMKDGIL